LFVFNSTRQIYKTPDSWKTNELTKEKKEKKADRAKKLRDEEEARKKKIKDKKDAKISKKKAENEETAEQRAQDFADQKARDAVFETERQAVIQEQERLRSIREEEERQSSLATRAAGDAKFKQIRAEKGIHCRSFALEGWCQAGRRCGFSHGTAESAAGGAVAGTLGATRQHEEKEEIVARVALSSLPAGSSWLPELEALARTHQAYVAKHLASGGLDLRIDCLTLPAGEVPAGMRLEEGIRLSFRLPAAGKYPGEDPITCSVLNEAVPANVKSQLRKAAYGCAKALRCEEVSNPLTMLVAWLEKNAGKLLVDRDAMEAMRARQQEIADSLGAMEGSDDEDDEEDEEEESGSDYGGSDDDDDDDDANGSSSSGGDPIDMAAFMDTDSEEEGEGDAPRCCEPQPQPHCPAHC